MRLARRLELIELSGLFVGVDVSNLNNAAPKTESLEGCS